MDSPRVWTHFDGYPGDGQRSKLLAPGDASFFDVFFLKLLKRRLPPVNVHGGLFNLKAFRNKAFTIYCISGIMILLGFYTGTTVVLTIVTPEILVLVSSELTYLSVSAVAIGVSKDFSFYILAIANAASALRMSFGLMSDKFGRSQ